MADDMDFLEKVKSAAAMISGQEITSKQVVAPGEIAMPKVNVPKSKEVWPKVDAVSPAKPEIATPKVNEPKAKEVWPKVDAVSPAKPEIATPKVNEPKAKEVWPKVDAVSPAKPEIVTPKVNVPKPKEVWPIVDAVSPAKSAFVNGTGSSVSDEPVDAGSEKDEIIEPEARQDPPAVFGGTSAEVEKVENQHVDIVQGSLGLDIGTTSIIHGQYDQGKIVTSEMKNAFFTLPYSKHSEIFLKENRVAYFRKNNQFFIVGDGAEAFANSFSTVTRRPMKNGIVNAADNDSVDAIDAIFGTIVANQSMNGQVVVYSTPGAPFGQSDHDIIYHEKLMKLMLTQLGYRPKAINEGLAVVFSELANDQLTGIAISMGGGMCNVCLSYMSFPVITFSVPKAGDYIDSMAGKSVNEPATKVKQIKEVSLDLSVNPRGKLETALHIFYDDVINTLVQAIQAVLSSSQNIPFIPSAIPLVISGGSSMPKGCTEKFVMALEASALPVGISDVRKAVDPMMAVVNGTLIAAAAEGGE